MNGWSMITTHLFNIVFFLFCCTMFLCIPRSINHSSGNSASQTLSCSVAGRRKRTMQMFRYLILMLVLGVVLTACAPSAQKSGDEMINPGDKIGDFLITTKDGQDILYMTFLHCAIDGTTETCDKPVGTRINVSQGFMSMPGKTPFEQTWSQQSVNMVIEGRPVNLQAFGYDEWVHPQAGPIRVWNVVVVAERPITISAASGGVFDGESWNYTARINFIQP
jgi:hypothetical protein